MFPFPDLPVGSEPPLEPLLPEHRGVPAPRHQRQRGHAIPEDDAGLHFLSPAERNQTSRIVGTAAALV